MMVQAVFGPLLLECVDGSTWSSLRASVSTRSKGSGEDRCMVMVPGRAFFWGGNLWWTWCEHLKTMARCLKDTTSVPWMHFDAFWIILAPLSAGPAMHFADVRRGKNASNYHFKLHRFECAGHLYHYGFLDAGSNPNPRQCVLPMHHRRTLASRLWCFVVLAVTVEMMSTEEEFSKMMPFQILLTFLNYHGTAQSIHSDTRSRMVQKGTLP